VGTASSDDTATFAVDMQVDGLTGPAASAAGALDKLRAKLDDDIASLAGMQKALRNLKGGGAVTAAQFKDLSDKIAAQKATVAQTQSRYLELGGTFKKLKPEGEGAESMLGALFKQLKASSGPLGEYSGALGELGETFAGGALVSGPVAVAAAVVALTVALVAGVVALTAYGIASGNAYRSELLHLEGLTKVRNYYGLAAGSAGEMQAAITKVAAGTAIGRDQLVGYEEQLYKTGLRGQNLTDALEGMATVASVQGEAQAGLFAAQAAGAARAGIAVKRLSDDVKARLGGIASAQLLDLNVQTKKLHESFTALFQDLKVDGALEALKNVTDLFSQNSESGKALKLLVETLFQPLIDQIGATGPIAKRFFQGMVLGALDIAIAVQKVRLWLRSTFGSSDVLKGINATSTALEIGKVAMYAFGVVLAQIALSLALVGAALLISFAPIIGIVALIGYVGKKLASFSWRESGKNLISGFVEGIEGGVSSVVKAVEGLGGAAINALKHALDSHSPSRLADKVAFTVPQGAVQGIDRGRPLVSKAAGRLGSDVIGSFGANMGLKPGGEGGRGRSSSREPVVIHAEFNFHGKDEPRERAESTRDALIQILTGVAASMGAELATE